MPTVNSQNFTTLYSATAQEIVPAEPYGNANVEAFLNIGTDGGNTVQNILANGDIIANGNIESNNFVADTTRVFIGPNAQGVVAVANTISIGNNAGVSNDIDSIAIGANAGGYGQFNIAIGTMAGITNNNHAVAIGASAGAGQGPYSTAVGDTAGYQNQGSSAVAIGATAGFTNQGANSVAIGTGAGHTNQAANSIVINATGTQLNQTTADSFTVKPVRNANVGNVLFYNPTSGEITYDILNSISPATANFANFAGNVTVSAQPNITSLGNLLSLTINNGSSANTYQYNPNLISVNTASGANTFQSVLTGSNTSAGVNEAILFNGSNATGNTPAYTQNFFSVESGNAVQMASIQVAGRGTANAANLATPGNIYFRAYSPNSNLQTGALNSLFTIAGDQMFMAINAPGPANTGVWGTRYFGQATDQTEGIALTVQRNRGNNASRTTLLANDYIGNIHFIAGGTGGSVGSRQARIAPKVDSSFIGSGTDIPIGIDLQVCNTTANITHNFYSNGNVKFADSIYPTGQIVFANNTRSPDILVSNNASNSTTRQLSLQAGNLDYTGVGSNQTAGSLRMNSGNSDGSGSATTWIARGGGQILAAGFATSNIGNAIGGTYNIFGGDATSLLTGNSTGGAFLMTGGAGTANVGDARSANMEFYGGGAYTETGDSQGGNIVITGGVATSNTSGNAVAGSIYIDTQPATGVTSSTQGNINLGIGNATQINIGNTSNTALSFYPYTEAIPGGSNVSLLKTSGNLRFDSGVYYNNWDWNIDNIIAEEKYYANDINTGNKVYFGKTSMLGYGSPGTQATPSIYAINVFETTSDLSNANTATGSFMQVGQGGFLAVVGSQINAPIFGLFNYGNTTQSEASAIRINRRRGNGDARTNVVASDYLGNVEWRGSGSATGSLNSKIVTFGAKVDSSYGGPGNVMPIGFEMDVVNSSNTLIAHSFYANGNINFNGTANAVSFTTANTSVYSNGLVNSTEFSTANTNIYANGAVNTNGTLTADNLVVDTNGFMKLSTYTAAGLNAITGQAGWIACVTDSASGGNPNAMIAFWDTTNARWSYIHDNSAV